MSSCKRAWLAMLFASVIGCGSGSTIEVVKVTGRVTLDDQPLEKGLIQFLPTDGKSSSAACEIRKGEYSAEVPVGNK